MKTNESPRGWKVHGHYPANTIAGTIPKSGVNYLAGPAGEERDVILVDFAVAAATGVSTCGLSPDRTSLAGFMRQPASAPVGVAILTTREKVEPMRRSVEANSLARGVSGKIPVAVTGDWSAEASGRMLAELETFFVKQNGAPLGLVVVDTPLPYGELSSLSRPDRAVLAVQNEAPGLTQNGAVVLAIDGNMLSMLTPLTGAPWSRAFSLDAITIGDDESLVVVPGEPLAPPIRKPRAAPVAPVAKEPEPLPIVSRVALIVSRGELSNDQRARWIGEGYSVVESQEAALPKPGEIEGGRREIVVAGEDQRAEELRGRATRLREEAIRLGVNDDILIRVAA